MSIVLDYVATTNSLTISDNGTITNVAGTGINNNFTVPQSFAAGVAVSGSTILQAVSGTTGNFTGAIGASGFTNSGSTILQAVSGTTGNFTGAVGVSGFTNSGSTTLQAVSGTTGNFTGAMAASAYEATNSSTLAGTSSGTVVSSQVQQGVAKEIVFLVNGYVNDTTTNQVINYPVALTQQVAVGTNTTGLTVSASLTALTITAPNATTAYNGVIVVQGG